MDGKWVLQTSDHNAIVDWVFVELRDVNDPKKVVATRSALLQRDGDVVDMNGVSALRFLAVENGEYHVAVRHRNHLGVMTANPFYLSETTEMLDFTDPDFPTYGTNALVEFGGQMVMQAGDFDQNGNAHSQGPANDIFFLFSFILADENNPNHATNHVVYGYHSFDIDLDGKVIYEGPGNERSKYFKHVRALCITNPDTGCLIEEQLPE